MTFALSSTEERDVLCFDPWGERDATYVTLRSGFVNARKPHQCDICFGPIAVGERVWAKTETDDGKGKTFRFCAECCYCIAHRFDELAGDDLDAAWMRMERRYDVGRQRAEAQRTSA
jgi:hypothetical protein